ncbi:MAG: glycosyltransferase [Hyphomonadaceae bacterium]
MPRTYVFSVPIGPAHVDRLLQTLKSLAAQPVPVKVALCDASGSAKCKAIADQFPDLIAYRRHGPDKGQSDAINEGWREIKGDIYSWLNADDYLAPNALAVVEQAFDTNPQADIVYGQSLILEQDGTYIGLHPAVGPNIDLISRSNIISQPSCFYKGELLEALGPVKQELDYTMDWELWVRFYKNGKTFVYTPETLSTVLWERGTKTSSVNQDRMREIRELTAQTHGPYVQLKTMTGFYLHYFSEYSALAPIVGKLIGWCQTRKMHRRSHWKAIPIEGLESDATSQMSKDRWCLKFYHYSDDPLREFVFNFFRPVSGTLRINGTEHRLQHVRSIGVVVQDTEEKHFTLAFSGEQLVPENLDSIEPIFGTN